MAMSSQITSTVTRYQTNRAALGCVGMGIHIMDVQQLLYAMLSSQYGPKYRNNVFKTLLNLYHKELKQF